MPRPARLHPIRRGVYAVGHPLISVEGRMLAAVLACGPGAVLSYRSAAAHWGIRPSASPTVDVTIPTRDGRKARAGIRLHRTARLDEREVTTLEGIAVTGVSRTILDLASVLPQRDLDRAIERAEQRRLFDLSSLQAVMRRNPGRKRVELPPEQPFTRSELEVFLLDVCGRHGLEEPRVNHRVEGLEVDFHWPRQRLIVEVDGRETHLTSAAFERDRARDAALAAAGWRLVRFTYLQVSRDRGELGALLRKLLG